MIYCVVPEALEQELLPKLEAYYAGEDGVQVIVDRRRSERRKRNEPPPADTQRTVRDRRRPRVPGEFPTL